MVEARDGSYYIVRGENGGSINPRDLLLALKKEFGTVFVLDIDGIERNAPDLKLIQRSAPLLPIWAYAGSRDIMGIMDVLVAGVDKVIIGTQYLLEMGLLKEAHEMTSNIIISFDHGTTMLCPSRNLQSTGIREMARSVKEIGVNIAIFFDLGRVSRGGDLCLGEIGILQEKFEEVYVAGILSPADIDKLAGMGVSGIIADFKSLREWGIKGDTDECDDGDEYEECDGWNGEEKQ